MSIPASSAPACSTSASAARAPIFGARYNHVLARRGELEPRLVYGFDIKAYKNNVLFAGENFGNDVTVRPLSIGLAGSVPLDGGEPVSR